ncbi:MAG: cyclic nucleotide-binding domain-containing protein [Bacteroidetes bacterium]|nr:cyclic nucleotide-binding domain-containing protein [Bacteroidota bacterium]
MTSPSSDIHAIMEDHVFFGGLRAEDREAIIELGQERKATSGSILFHHGDPYRGFYLLLTGSVHIYRLSESGRMLVLHVIRPGESFAEVPLFEPDANSTYPATAETLEDSRLLFIPAEPFLHFVDERPRACLHMLGEIARRQRDAVRQLDALSLQDVQGRLARHLAKRAATSTEAESPTIQLDIPKAVLAAELGTVPETLSRALRSLEQEGLIRSESSAITVEDMDRLQEMGMYHG